jgi:hypothetical protein
MTESAATPHPSPATSSGILLIALGASEYGNMAANLAASIRYGDPHVPIHLVYSDKALNQLTPAHRALFTSFAECPAEYYTKDGGRRPKDEIGSQTTGSPHQPPVTEYIKAKTHIYDLTPYDETLFLDVDMYILPATHMTSVIGHLSSICHYTIENRGYADLGRPDDQLSATYSYWVNILDVKRHYKTEGRFYQLHSEFVFFKKNEKNKVFFGTVREVYDTRPLKWQVFDGAVPDEYAFDIATAITGHYPHQNDYITIYWHGMDGRKDWNKVIIKNYIGFSLGGSSTPEWISQKVTAYKQLFKQKLNLPTLFNVPPKRRWNAKRRPM